jgi:hypothetical protein
VFYYNKLKQIICLSVKYFWLYLFEYYSSNCISIYFYKIITCLRSCILFSFEILKISYVDLATLNYILRPYISNKWEENYPSFYLPWLKGVIFFSLSSTYSILVDAKTWRVLFFKGNDDDVICCDVTTKNDVSDAFCDVLTNDFKRKSPFLFVETTNVLYVLLYSIKKETKFI